MSGQDESDQGAFEGSVIKKERGLFSDISVKQYIRKSAIIKEDVQKIIT